MMLSAALAFIATSNGCEPVAGFEKIVTSPRVRWIVVGEMHGTNEMPAAFSNLACIASRIEPIVVAVEQPEQDQAAIDAFLASDGGENAEAVFLKATMWRAGQPDNVLDGRSSQAMFTLFRRLWAAHKDGRVTRIIAFQPNLAYKAGAFRMPWLDDKPVIQVEYEKRMAALLERGIGKSPKMLVLTGSAHARKIPMKEFPDLQPMATFLPPNQTVTLLLSSNGKGKAWNCSKDGCGVHEVGEETRQGRGLIYHDRPEQPYSVTLFLGTSMTASLPKRG